MFWYGFFVGLFIGANLGLLIIGVLIAARPACADLPARSVSAKAGASAGRDEKARPCNRRRGEEVL